MFYSQSLLSRKGPLGNIWMAAYCFKRLRRDQIAGTDISSSIDKIKAEDQISYRVLAQLLLGVVRIFSRKVEYLYKDCEEFLTHISQWTIPKEAVRKHRRRITAGKEVILASNRNATALNEVIPVAPMELMLAPYHHLTITVPERFELDTFELEGIDEDYTAKHHEQSIIQDELIQERNEASFLNECNYRETVAHAEFNYACFTPVNDVLPSDMMNMDIGISEFWNSSISEVKRQKPRGDFWDLVESDSHEHQGARISLGPSLHDEEAEHQVRLLNLPETVLSDIDKKRHTEETKDQAKKLSDHELSHGLTNGHLDTIARAKTSDKSNLPCDAGATSPKFTVTTPAKRELLSRKRKTLFDETIVLSNETLRLGIHDASSLVCKRRKLPHTILDAWKSCRITKLQHKFMDPLIPFISSDLNALFQQRFSDHKPRRKIIKSLNAEVNRQNDISSKLLDVGGSLQERTVETMEASTPNKLDEAVKTLEASTPSKLDEAKVRESSTMETLETGSDLMDLELGSHEKGSNDQDDVWPLRTRAMAQYLRNTYFNTREQEQKVILSLAQILEGKTRTECARYFYETLALKNRGCISVKQDLPYDDIIISPMPKLEAVPKNI